MFEDAGHEVGVGVHYDDGVAVPARRLLLELVREKVVHEGGLAHARACDVEVVAAQQVVREAYLPLRPSRGIPHQRAAPDALRRGAERPCAGALHKGRLVSCSRRVPQGGHFADAQDAAPPEQAGACRMQHVGIGNDRSHLPHPETRPGGVVVVAVGRHHRFKQVGGPLLPRGGGQHCDDPDLGVEGDAGDLLAYQEGVVDGRTLEEARLHPARRDEARSDAESQQGGLPRLVRLHPLIRLEGDQRADAKDGHAETARGLRSSGLRGIRGLWRPGCGTFVDEALVVLRPSGAEGTQQQAGDDALSVAQVGERAEQGYEGVGAGVGQVGVPEGAQGHVFGTRRAQDHRPRLLAAFDAQRVLPRRDLVDARLGIVGRDLAPDHLSLLAAGHEGDSPGVARELEGEGLRYGDGGKEVLDAEERALAGARRRHRQQHRRGWCGGKGLAFGPELHGCPPFLRCVDSLVPSGPPLDDVGLLRRGLHADGEAPAAREQEAVAPGA